MNRLFGKSASLLKVSMILLITLALTAGCAPQPKPLSSIAIAGASKGGVWNPLSIEMAEKLPNYIPGISFSAIETLGSVDNLKLLESGEAQVIFAHSYHITMINKGELPEVTDDKMPVRILFGLYEQPLQIVVRQDSGINNISDLIGKRVSTGVPGGCAEEMAEFVFSSMGIDIDKGINRQKLDVLPSGEALKNNEIDAFFWTGAIPTSTITKLFTDLGSEVKLLSFTSAEIEKIMNDHPGVYHPASIEEEAYPGVQGAIDTVGINAVIAANESFDAALAEKFVAAFFENRDEFADVWPGAASISTFSSFNMLSEDSLDYLHPGAENYFLKSLKDPEIQFQIGKNWVAGCIEAGYDGSNCAEMLLDFMQP